MQQPLVTIICISFNHSAYLKDALTSIGRLNYTNIQLIIADDASTDNSQELIKELVAHKHCELLLNATNIGHCKTFNKALLLAKGEYVIDLAADDILVPDSINVAVAKLEEKGESYGVFFADAELIDNSGSTIGEHKTQSYFKDVQVPEEDVYSMLLSKYFINPPTMVFRKSLLDTLNGYNEEMSYEDFDFWVRSSRVSNYCYEPVITIQKRILSTSVSSQQYDKNSKMLSSTLSICKTALELNKTKLEDVALLKRIGYEGKMSLTSRNYFMGLQFFILGIKVLFKIRL